MRALLTCLLRAYQLCISPMLPHACRFSPSCSHYAKEAIETHGGLKGSLMAIRRVARCHPFGAAGHDPVPARKTHLQQGDC